MNDILQDGFLLFDKQKGLTSFNAISEIKKYLKLKKIGHAGTLDKNASGLLIIGIGKSTKLLKFILNMPKIYLAEIYFGAQTTTDDPEGSIIKTFNGKIDYDKILKCNLKYIGKIKQIPPDYSAVHVNGKRAYKLAIENKNVNIKEREVEIFSNNIISFNNNILTLEINCSSGTYIRSIARDLGNDTGYYAYLKDLKRISIGNFNINSAYNIEDIKNNNFKYINPYDMLSMIKSIEIKEEFIKDILNGKPVKIDFLKEKTNLQNGLYKLHNNKNIIAIVNLHDNIFKYDMVY
jgi:tRNA pseudouridine55 synthase